VTLTTEESIRRWARIDRATDRRERQHRRRRGGGAISVTTLRVHELQRLFVDNYNGPLPQDDSGMLDLWIMANHMAGRIGAERKNRTRILSWCKTWAPWLPEDAAGDLADRALRARLKWRADTLGRQLGVTMDQRQRLRLRTIGSYEITAKERAAHRAEWKRARQEARRREAGAIIRSEYEAGSLAQAKPWEALGMSRRSWYRAGKPTALAQVRTQYTDDLIYCTRTCATEHANAPNGHSKRSSGKKKKQHRTRALARRRQAEQ
jgi:hypothetical protein